MNSAHPVLGRIAQIALSVSDLPRSVAFWRDVVGLRFLFEVPNLAFFDVAGVRLMLGIDGASASKPSGVVLYFEVDDLEAMFALLRDRGVTVEHPNGEPHFIANLGANELWMAFLRDPDGHLFALMSERAPR
jgi:catechol 2,3-dioxygenase-like lactoylglutathione lyase family enzyme